jgi:phenylalanine-4-hydroxylase
MLPGHLKRYVVEQDYSRYTPVDQEVWRFIMRQLKEFHSKHAHPCYVDGLGKTGIEVDRIPHIHLMSEKLEKFGWRAIPVSGFIPPAAFMEMQSLGFLPIASDMRAISHLMYTPAPDIVHEAAGHAPILVDEEFAAYLKAYAQVAKHALISHEDMNQYEAIRVLSDLKEDPHSSDVQIQKAEKELLRVSHEISHLSEAALLSRMNWWTAEYGLIGTLASPKIFGAGLLSSIAEARGCLDPKVKKIPLTVDCINYSYDITEPQPQLFVTPDFACLRDVLEQLAARMAYRHGGLEALAKNKRAQTVNTVELNSGLQISGRLKDYLLDGINPAYLQFEGPTQLSYEGVQLPGHGTNYHANGFGSPLGHLDTLTRCLSELKDSNLRDLGIVAGLHVELKFRTGSRVKGRVREFTRAPNGKLLLISFEDCTVTRDGNLLFDPAWGIFDMACGTLASSVYSGPSDRELYGETNDFVAKIIPRKVWEAIYLLKHRLYQEVREIREGLLSGKIENNLTTSDRLDVISTQLESDFPHDWLLRLGLYELGQCLPSSSWLPRVEIELKNLGDSDSQVRAQVLDGMRLLK